jgi:hypothetical protein
MKKILSTDRRKFMNYPRIFISFLIILSLVGCNGTNLEKQNNIVALSKMSYSEPNERSEFKEGFKPEGFINISPDTPVIKTVSFPKNQIDERQTDTLNNVVSYPINLEQYYKDQNSDLIIKVNFFYNEETRKTGFVGINSVIPFKEVNIVEKYKANLGTLFYNYYLSYGEFFVVITFINGEHFDKEEEVEEASMEFTKRSLSFYEQFENHVISLRDKHYK